MSEIFRDIPGYEGLYQVSNLGRVKSLPRKVWNGKYFYMSKERILKPGFYKSRYYIVSLRKDNRYKTYNTHKLVAITFLNHTPNGYKIVVDHINNIRTDNRLENLQLITQRENSSKDKKGSSKYTGVCWDKSRNKWIAMITINGKSKYLGRFNSEIEASIAYQNKLKEYEECNIKWL